MPRAIFAKPALAVAAAFMTIAPLTSAAQAQGNAPYRGDPSATGYDYRTPPPEPGAPDGYDGRQLPPPPPGYAPSPNEPALRAADDRYAAEANRWASENCVKSPSNAGSGALIGGILGAIIGSGVSGRHDHGGGMAAGAAIGAIGGAAIGSSSSGDTSPGCPPGYSVRRQATTYAYPAADYAYAAPGWYRPWVYSGGYWAYRPYPYRDYYYRTWRAGPGYAPRAYYGRDWQRRDWQRRDWQQRDWQQRDWDRGRPGGYDRYHGEGHRHR